MTDRIREATERLRGYDNRWPIPITYYEDCECLAKAHLRAVRVIESLRVYVDHVRDAVTLSEAVDAIGDDFVNAGKNCQSNLLDLRNAMKDILKALGIKEPAV